MALFRHKKETQGPLAQLVERFHGMEEVRGSNPLISTKLLLASGSVPLDREGQGSNPCASTKHLLATSLSSVPSWFHLGIDQTRRPTASYGSLLVADGLSELTCPMIGFVGISCKGPSRPPCSSRFPAAVRKLPKRCISLGKALNSPGNEPPAPRRMKGHDPGSNL